MSRQLENKKETARRVSQFYSVINAEKNNQDKSSEFKLKYNLLLKRYSELETVYQFQKSIIQGISSGLIHIDREGKITFVNKASCEILRYSHTDLKGQNLSILFADENEGKKIVDKMLTKKAVYESKETHLINSEGKIIPVGFSTTNLDDEVKGQIFVFRNISQVSHLRKQIERMDRLATLGELSAGIAHEIRNPLAGMKTSAQVLEESFSPGDFRSQLVTRIVKEIDRSNELLKRFFNYAKPSKPKQDFYNIEMIIDGVYLLMAPRLKKKKITFRTEFSSESPQIFIDESQIEQVFLNMFINAVEAMKNGGEISIETGVEKHIKLAEDKQEGPALFIKIKDTGPGLSPENTEKIFNPFFTTKSDGVGLGLSISSRLVEENGGKIEVESIPEKGACFSVYFPIIEAKIRTG